MKLLNWLLYEVHRWVGVVLAVFMFVWFTTGLVIMYSTPTTQTRSQQLAHAEILAPEQGWLSLGEVWERSVEQRKQAVLQRKSKVSDAEMGRNAGNGKTRGGDAVVGIADARLLRILGEPLWLVEDTRGQRFALSAIDGSLREFSAEQALKIAQNWYKTDDSQLAVKVNYLETLDSPIILRNQEALRPFHHITVGDSGDEVLISALSGEVLHASTRLDRAFFWAGNWIHLFKPLESIGLGHIRHDVQLWSGLAATVATMTGLIIGWLRWRPGFNGKKTYSEGRTQPYREFWYKWHFWSGLLGGSVALFWAFSGYIDTNPGKIFGSGEVTREEFSHYLGGDLPDLMRNWQPSALDAATNAGDVVELNWRRLGDESVLIAYDKAGRRYPQQIGADGITQFSDTALTTGVNRLSANAKIESLSILHDYDSYYYPRHHQGLVEKPLPVVLVKLADADGSRFYLDPQDGRLLSKLDQSRRVFRWLYSALHHWDFGWLYYRPIWDVWMLIWVGFGVVLGGSSLVIAWRRLQKTFAPKKRKSRKTQGVTSLGSDGLVMERTGD